MKITFVIIYTKAREFVFNLLSMTDKITLFKNSFRNTIRMSNSLDPDQVRYFVARHFVRPNMGPNCLPWQTVKCKIPYSFLFLYFKGLVNLQKTFFKLLLIEKPVMRKTEWRKPLQKIQNSYRVMKVQNLIR